MSSKESFSIYNASAGSGKTFTLVKAYLKILFTSGHALSFRNILALTFTNKAVAEMKDRVIKMLVEFSNPDILIHPTPMFVMLSEELERDHEKLHQQSNLILHHIVHNYAAFDISTIDKFNHRLIRTFAHDLKLPLNFEVELDTKTILAKAVDKLIDRAGTDKVLTKLLVDFAIEKADDDKSWDISYDFNKIAQLLTNENDLPYINSIKDKSLDDFGKLKSSIANQIKQLTKDLIQIGEDTLKLIEEQNLIHNDFSRGSLPNYFIALTNENFKNSFDSKWQTEIETAKLYPSRVSEATAATIDSLQPILSESFQLSKQGIYQLRLLKNIIKNITPLSVLNAIYTSLQEIKAEEDLVLISEFNAIISNEIKSQPAPFIYERIGEKFKHYFIDEFQDTSVKQWENLIPLIDNTLISENLKGETGTAMLVGDAKQAIYRWRGGKAEQFIDLYNLSLTPFQIQQSVANLPANYRSLKTIVEFNNSFFKHLSNLSLSDASHVEIYKASFQDYSLNQEGYVDISFLECEKTDKDDEYGKKVMDIINTAQNNNFELRDICIITRKTKEANALAEYLSCEGIPIISSESLLLCNSPEVQFLTNLIALAAQPNNDLLKIEILDYLAEYHLNLEDKHQFFESLIHRSSSEMFQGLSIYELHFDLTSFHHLPFYEAVESAIRSFGLHKTPNAYIQFFLDIVLDYSQGQNVSFSDFTSYWNVKKDKLAIASPQGHNAVQLMTIHKAKGLEFPIVIFPYANQDIYFDMSPTIWLPVDPKNFNGFENVFININKDLEESDSMGKEIYKNYRAQLELDSINLLYVVLTRAVEQLFIITEYDLDKSGNEKLNYYSGLFINYLKSLNLWVDSTRTYHLGNPQRKLNSKPVPASTHPDSFISVAKEDHNLKILTNAGYLWDTAQEAAIEKGNLVHLLMSQIKSKEDVSLVFDIFERSGDMSREQSQKLKVLVDEIIAHPQLSPYFEKDKTIYNERDILASGGLILRPDRIVINKMNESAIIDYKTGVERSKHFQQLREYQSILEEMGFKVLKKILVYINEDIQIKEF